MIYIFGTWAYRFFFIVKILVSIMAQEYHFNSSREGIGAKELKEVFTYTDDTIRSKLKVIYEKGLIDKTKGRPAKYIISNNYLESK